MKQAAKRLVGVPEYGRKQHESTAHQTIIEAVFHPIDVVARLL